MKRKFESFEPTPFYFLNDAIDRDELVRQLDFMQENGIGSFFLHLRDGITTQAWGTDLFFSHVRFIAEESFKRGITMWLYDEDSYPSGQCGGQVVIDRPELEGRTLKILKKSVKAGETVREVLGRARGVGAFCLSKENGAEKMEKLASPFGTVRANWYRMDWHSTYYCDMLEDGRKYHHVRALTGTPETVFEAEMAKDGELYIAYTVPASSSRYTTNLDCTRKDSFAEYKARILDKYKKAVGDMFGVKIPGMFIDEPTVGSDFSPEMCEYFYNKFGYRLEDNLYKLSKEYDGDSRELRRHYAEARKSMFMENFLLPIKDWCRENGLKLTGHFVCEEDPLTVSSGQSVYRQTRIMDIPGFDIITTNIGDLDYCALILGANIVASAAEQFGKERVLAEAFALSPFNMDYRGLKKTADWLFACGINWIVPHGFHYGYSAYQRADAGKSFFFQDVRFEDYKRFSAYAGRVCKLLCDYRRDNDLLLVYPDAVFCENLPLKKKYTELDPSEMPRLANENMRRAVRCLLAHHVGWDMADPAAVFEGAVIDGKFKLGSCSYSRVAVIKGGDVELSAYEYLKNSGIDCVLYDGTDSSFFTHGVEVIGEGERVQIYRKASSCGELLFLFNNSDKYRKIGIKVGESCWVYDAEEDLSKSIAPDNGIAYVSLQAYGSLILVCGSEAPSDIGIAYRIEEEDKTVPEYVTNPDFVYKPVGTRSVISEYDLTVEKDGTSQSLGTVRRDPIRSYLGTADVIFRQFYYRPGFDTAKRFDDIYPCKISYKVKIQCADKEDYLLFDKHSIMGEYKLLWNGIEIPADKLVKKRVYDMSNFAFYPDWRDGENILEILLDKAGEFDGATGDIFVMKG